MNKTKITKNDVARTVSNKTQKPIKHIIPILNAVIDTLFEYVVTTETTRKIELRGFGVIEVKYSGAKPRARNPKTGEPVSIPRHRKVHLKPGKDMKAFLMETTEEPFRGLD